MEFYGRKEETRKLERLLKKQGEKMCLIYGRRRVGKSELVKHVIRTSGEKYIYYECKQTTEMNNTNSLAVLIGEYYGFPKPSFSGIEEELEYLFKASCREKMILVLDEYPYLREAVTGMDSILQSLIDRYRDDAQMKLILCGSWIDVMKSLLERENPLYGRSDLSIDLKPMNYLDSSLFYQSFSDNDKVRLYSVFGGIPYFNKMIDPDMSVRENIIDLIASPDAQLINEVPAYLHSEIAKITNANEVFEVLAQGYSKYSDILSQSHVSSAPAMVDTLDKLIGMEIVKKEAPINDENNKKKTGYFITDRLSDFYYRYIFRYLSQLNVMNPDDFHDRFIDEDFESQLVPQVFEDICRQYLILQNKAGKMDVPFEKIGKYWYDDPVNHKNGEFDVVTMDSKGYVFYEVKFRKKAVTREMIDEEIKQVNQCGLSCRKYGFFSRTGFDAEPRENEVFIPLEKLYER